MSDTVRYDDETPRLFFLAAILWCEVALLVGVLVAAMLFLPGLNLAPYLTFGRLRPLHTNAAIFAFVGNMIFGGVYHSIQRLLKRRLWSDALSKVHFWGWQLLIVGAALALVFGITQGKEYAELPWVLDIVIAALWVIFAVNFFGTLATRREKHLYVAIWFYITTILAIRRDVGSAAGKSDAKRRGPRTMGIAYSGASLLKGGVVAFSLLSVCMSSRYWFR